MSKIKHLIFACSIAFFACSDNVAGTEEERNALAQKESSSSVASESSASGTNIPVIIGIPDTVATPSTSISSSSRRAASSSAKAAAKSSSSNVTYYSMGVSGNPGNGGEGYGGFGTLTPCDTTSAATSSSPITIDSIIEGRIKTLVANGLSQDQAQSTAKDELFKAIGLDSLLLEKPDTRQTDIDNVLNTIFGGTTQSDFFKKVKEDFAKTGTLSLEQYCNFAIPVPDASNKQYFEELVFPGYVSYDTTSRKIGGCITTEYISVPANVINNVRRKCMGLPYCNSSLEGTIIKAGFKLGAVSLEERDYICKESGWDKAPLLY